MAELSSVLRLAQPRVSTHLAKLKEAGVVRDRRAGVSAYYRFNGELDAKSAALLHSIRANVEDALIVDDAQRLPTILAQRARAEGWADSVAGDMERHYSPGRTWEALARAVAGLIETGDVLDIALWRRRARRAARAACAHDRLRRHERARRPCGARPAQGVSPMSTCGSATCTPSILAITASILCC